MMKRWMIGLAALLFVTGVRAEDRSLAVLRQLTSAFTQMSGYSVDFEVQTADGAIPGYYEVNGPNYYMQVNDMEAYGDAQFRYEVNSSKREIVIDLVDLESHNLLNNPTRAFDFVEGEYATELLDETDQMAVIRLTPKSVRSAVGAIDIEVDTTRSMPVAVIYEVDGDRVRIDIRAVSDREASALAFDRSKYPDYEWIDFR